MKSVTVRVMPMLLAAAFVSTVGLISPTSFIQTAQAAEANRCAHELHAFTYPLTATGTQVDSYHGVKVADPYRWLEDANSEATKAWVIQQNQFTQDYLSKIPQRAAFMQRLQTLWNYERFKAPIFAGNRYFLSRNDGLQNQDVLYTMKNLKDTPQVLLDPNTLSNDGTVALGEFRVSPNGQYLAYSVSQSGSDWQEWRVRDIATGKDLPEVVQWTKFTEVAWKKDSSGFFYGRFDKPLDTGKLADVNYYQKLYFHKIGTAQKLDQLVYQRPDQKEWGFDPKVSDDGDYLVITVQQGTDNRTRLYYRDLKKKNSPVVKLLDSYDAEYTYMASQGPIFWLRTDKDAPRRRIVKIDIREPKKLIEVVPQGAHTISESEVVDGRLLLTYMKDARAQVMQYDMQGKFEREVDLPGIGSVKGFQGGQSDKETFYSFANFTSPSTVYRYEPSSGKSDLVRAPKLAFDPSAYETRQVFYTSRDGTRVPMFISSKKGLKLDGNNPTILYGYGGFDVSLMPSFSAGNLAWMEAGGVYVLANLRGGGEYGKNWHEAGTKLKKQNVFDDFIAAAEYLHANKYTQPSKLAISGGSNGGLLVGATMVQRPDLFAAAMPAVGVLDMLRFHKFTIGWSWTSDYGSSDDATQFQALYAYSPVHRVKGDTCYPATLITTGDHDDRVVPAHSYKFAAALQAKQGGAMPIMIRIDTKTGHGAGKPISKQLDEAADKFAFLSRVLDFAPSLIQK